MRYLLISLLFLSITANAQFATFIEFSDTSFCSIGYKSLKRIYQINDTIYFKIYSHKVQFKRLKVNYNDGTPISIVWADDSGYVKRSPISSLSIGWSNVTGKPSFSTVATSGSYNDLANKPTIPNGQVNSDWNSISGVSQILNKPTIISYTAGSGISLASNVITNTAPDQTVSLTAGKGISISGTYPNFTISVVTPTFSYPTRTLNSNFTPNSSKEVFVYYTVTCSVTNPLLIGTSTANAFLEISTNGGSSWQLASQVGNSSGVGLTVSVQLTNGQTGFIAGVIPANALVRIRTTTTGTASVTYVAGQEIVY